MLRAFLVAMILVGPVGAQGVPAPGRARGAGGPSDFDRIKAQADSARTSERMDEATALYRKGVALRPAWTEGWWYLATILYDQDRYAEARDAFRSYVRLDPKSGPGYALLGLCLFQTREYGDALASLKQADALGFGGNEQMREVAFYHQGMLLTHFEQYDAALRHFLKFAERGMDSAALIEAVGIAALRRPLFPFEVPPGDHDLVMATGAAVWDVGARRNGPAAEKFKALIARFPNVPNIHYAYGTFLAHTNPDEALNELLKELEISPGHVPCLIETGLEYLKRGEAERALPFVQKAAKLEPESFVAHNALGRVLVEADKLEEAIKELEKARTLAPDSAQTRFALGAAYRRAGRSAEAAKEMAEFERLKKVIEGNAGQAKPPAPR